MNGTASTVTTASTAARGSPRRSSGAPPTTGPSTPRARFLDASEARRRGERAARRRRRLAVGAWATALVATIGVGLTTYFAARERDIAASRDLATKSGSLIATDPALGQAVALEALAPDTPQAENAVRQARSESRHATAHAHDGVVNDVAVDGDGLMLTAGEDGRVRLWSLDGLEPVATIERYEGSCDGGDLQPRRNACGGVYRTARSCWRRSPAARAPAAAPLDGDFARTVEFTPDGKSLLVATATAASDLAIDVARRPSQIGHHRDRRARISIRREPAPSARATT